MVKKWFCKKANSKDAVSDFYKRTLMKYDEKIDKNDPLVKKCSANLPSVKNAKFYAVTGEWKNSIKKIVHESNFINKVAWR